MNECVPVYIEKRMTVAELFKKYDVPRPSPEEIWLYGKKDPFLDMKSTDEVIVVHTRYVGQKKQSTKVINGGLK